MNNFDLGLIFTFTASPWTALCCQLVPTALLCKNRARTTEKIPSTPRWRFTRGAYSILRNIPTPSPNPHAYEHASMAAFAPVMNAHMQALLLHMQFLYHRERLQEGMSTFGISLNKSSQDVTAIAETATRTRCNGEGTNFTELCGLGFNYIFQLWNFSNRQVFPKTCKITVNCS